MSNPPKELINKPIHQEFNPHQENRATKEQSLSDLATELKNRCRGDQIFRSEQERQNQERKKR